MSDQIACPVCEASLSENARECPSCGAILSPPGQAAQPVSIGKARYPWRSTARRAAKISAEKKQISAEKNIERKIKAVKESLDAGDFTNAIKLYQSERKLLPQLKHAKLFTALFDLLEQSAGILIRQKKNKVTVPSPSLEPNRPRSPSLIGRLIVLPVLILAGFGLLAIIDPHWRDEPLPPTPIVAPATSTQFSTAIPTATSLPNPRPISSANLREVRDLFNWSAGEDIVSLAFSPDGNLIASGDGSGTIKVWRVWMDEMLFELDGTHAIFSPDGRWIGVVGSPGTRMYDASNGKLVRIFDESRRYYSVLFSPDSQLIVGGSGNGRFYIWSVNDGSEQKAVGNIDGPIHSLSFSQDSRLLAVASNNNTYVWNMQEQKIERSIDFLKQTPVYLSVAIDSDGEWFAMGHEDGQMYIWRMSNGERMATFNDDSRLVHGLQFLQDSNSPEILVSGDEVNLTFWVMQGYEITNHSIYVSTPILSIAVEPQNKLIATGGRDGVIHLWGVLP